MPTQPETFRNADEAINSLFPTGPAEPTPAPEQQAPEGEDAELETATEEQPEPDSEEVEASEQDTEEEAPEVEEEPLYSITVNGREEQVTLDELRNGYQRQSDYTRKSQSLSEERKKLESEHSTLNEELTQYRTAREEYAELVNQLSGALKDQGLEDPDPALYQKDPVMYLRLKDEARTKREKLEQLEQEQQKIQQEKQAEFEEVRKKVLQAEHEKILSAVPDWKDEVKYNTDMAELRQYGRTVGYTDQEMNMASDSRAILALRKAMLYDKLMSGQSKQGKAPKPKVVRGPGQGNQTRAASTMKKAQQSFSKKQDVNSAVDLLLARRQSNARR